MSDMNETLKIEDIENFGKIEETPIKPVATEDNVLNITSFVKRYANLEKQIKTIKADIKELKHEFELTGLSTKIALKAYNNIKRSKKSSASELEEIDFVQNIIENDADCMTAIADLMSKEE